MSKPFYVNPLKICSDLYGPENVNDVRDCLLDSIRRYYGPFCDFHQQGLFHMINSYLVQILQNAGRNPKAVKLAFSPTRLQPRFFVERYFQTLDKQKAYNLCMNDCGDNGDCRKHCLIDRESMVYYEPCQQ